MKEVTEVAADPLPRVDYFALGGTIASVRGAGTGVVPSLTASDIAASVDGLDRVAQVRMHQFSQTASSEITVETLTRLVRVLHEAVDQGSQGLVITQGTDTIEETAFALDLLWDADVPLVITGAMRNPSLPGAEGPANLLSAVQLAADKDARGLGALVCLNDQINSARFVHKTHTSSPSTFASPGLGPIGWVSEGRPMIAMRTTRRTHIDLSPDAPVPAVALVRVGLGDDGRLLDNLADLGYQGAVLEAMGGGHVPSVMLPLVARLQERMPIILASRTGSGEVLTSTYSFAGSEVDLLRLGAIRAGALDGLKARLLLTLCLAAGYGRDEIVSNFELVGMTAGPATSATAQGLQPADATNSTMIKENAQ